MTTKTRDDNEHGCSTCHNRKRFDAAAHTTETAERWECDVRVCEQSFGKTLDEDVKIGVTFAWRRRQHRTTATLTRTS